MEPIRIGSGLNDTLLLDLLLGLGYSSIPFACGLAVLRYRLYEIDRIISRTITYVLVAGALGAVYIVFVAVVSWLLPTQNSLAVAGSALLIAALSSPLRRRVQHRVDRRFNRPAYQAEVVSDQFASRLRESLTVEELLPPATESRGTRSWGTGQCVRGTP